MIGKAKSWLHIDVNATESTAIRTPELRNPPSEARRALPEPALQ
jgi:hypothetical protein